jgi:poly-beta-1,6-N-acetyl-D-glucosamine synthase
LLFTTEHILPENDLAMMRLVILFFMLPIFLKYIVQLTAAPWYSFLEKRQNLPSTVARNPRVSVLIPAWNEEVGILKTIQSVLNTHYEDLELIVINDGSTDRTHELVTSFLESYKALKTSANKADFRYLSLSNGGKAKAMNEGVKQATGEFILTVDADSVMDSKAINAVLRRFDDPKVGAVAGNVIIGNRKQRMALLQQLEYLYGFFFKRADSVFNAVYIIGGAAAAYRKTTLDRVGGFDESIITEDIEMSTRILANGYKTRYAADAVVYTEGPSDWKGLSQQRLRWKYGRLLTFIKHRKLFFNRKVGNPYLSFLILPIAVYADIALLFEAFLLAAFYGYTIFTNDYLPLACVIVFVSSLVCLQIACDSKARFHRNIICLAPIAWVLFYVIDAVEVQALFRSLKRLIKRQSIEWQSWSRVGLLHKSIAPKAGSAGTENPLIDPDILINSIEQNLELRGGN